MWPFFKESADSHTSAEAYAMKEIQTQYEKYRRLAQSIDRKPRKSKFHLYEDNSFFLEGEEHCYSMEFIPAVTQFVDRYEQKVNAILAANRLLEEGRAEYKPKYIELGQKLKAVGGLLDAKRTHVNVRIPHPYKGKDRFWRLKYTEYHYILLRSAYMEVLNAHQERLKKVQ